MRGQLVETRKTAPRADQDIWELGTAHLFEGMDGELKDLLNHHIAELEK
jgi:hypothetical protein